ncbi:oligosaccharide flippase family protein [Leptothoe spongobia]|uniref:Oligosaccharide flippase family protein n=1 Tax=Leptothoe spongobia TAU-MAC 1115 TaxID=1967444 RepID=A0A947GL42_9CYAN|nr:oligosaccharide flippase family protein [Leptothoe spongobia]MBT9317203.1 oligosaccharide flippase family protein [Leptothoe spongobia TAU-MAC 1115]
MSPQPSLKSKVLKGSFYLTLRQLLASGFSLVSTLVIARMLGPESYGIVSAALGIFYFLRWTSRFGLGAYLVRKPDFTPKDAEQILAFYNTCGVLLCLGIALAAPLFGWWVGRHEITKILWVLTPAIWLDMVSIVSSSLLNRALRFDQISLVEAIAQTANYILSVILVLSYHSYWGPICGTLLQFLIAAILARRFYPVHWTFRWQRHYMKPAIAYGFSYNCSNWLFNLRSLTVPLFVGRLVGIEAVGIINIAVRMVAQLMLLRGVLKRMSISVMAKLTNDKPATRRALTKGMMYQALMMGLVCSGFASCASWLIPTVFGDKWLLSAQMFPLIGIATLVGAIFDLHTAVLYAVDRNHVVSWSNLAYIALLWPSCLLLTPIFGVWGYAISEILALPTYYLVHRAISKQFGSPEYHLVFGFVLASIPPCLASIWFPLSINFGVFLLSYGILFLISSGARKLLLELWAIIAGRFTKKQVA